MVNCVNIKHPDFKKLVNESKLTPFEVEMLVAKYQLDRGLTTAFPTLTMLNEVKVLQDRTTINNFIQKHLKLSLAKASKNFIANLTEEDISTFTNLVEFLGNTTFDSTNLEENLLSYMHNSLDHVHDITSIILNWEALKNIKGQLTKNKLEQAIVNNELDEIVEYVDSDIAAINRHYGVRKSAVQIVNNPKYQLTQLEANDFYSILTPELQQQLNDANINKENFREVFNSELKAVNKSNLFFKIWSFIRNLFIDDSINNIITNIKRGNIDSEFTEQGNMMVYGITKYQALSRIPYVNELLHKGIIPFGYDLQFALAEMPQYLKQDRVYNTFLLSSQKLAEKYDQDTSLITRRQYQNREDAWRLSNGLPQQYNTFKFIKLDADGNALYDFVEPMLNRATLDAMGNNKPTDLAVDKENLVMGNYPLKVGNDNIGSYIEYTDVWDLTVGTAKAPSNVNNTALTLARKVVQGAIGTTQQPFTVKNKVYKALTYDQSGNEVIYYTQNVDNVDIKFYNDFMSKLNNIEASEQYSTDDSKASEPKQLQKDRGEALRVAKATIKEGVSELFESNTELANEVYEALGFENKPNTIASTIFELEPDITKEKLRTIYDNYVALMNRQREGKALSYDVFESLLKTYQVYKHKDTYIFGNYDTNTATFITRLNSSPSSKELLAEAIPNLVEKGLDFISFVPKDYADKLVRSGYTTSVSSFNYNFKGEEMDKFAVASNPNVFEKIFNKSYDNVTSEEIESYNQSQDLKYTPVEINAKLIKKAGKDTSKIFETYLNQFGITVKNINEIKDRLEIDEIGFADLLSKIAYVKDKKDLPPIAGEFIAYMMQYNPLVEDIITELSKTDKYKDLDKPQYFKIIGELISQDLQNKTRGNYNQSLIDKVKELINKFLELFKSVPIDTININIGTISNNVLQQNKKLITVSLYKPGAYGKPTQQVSIEEALKKDKFGASIIYKLSEQGFILTGSTALSEQGVILRSDENPLHDIDWVSPFTRKETEEKFLESYPNAIKVRDIYGDSYITDSYLISPEGYSISNYKVDNFDGKIIIKSYDVVDSKWNVVGTYRLQKQESNNQSEEVVTGVEGKVIDFFSYNNYSDRNPNKPFNYKSKEGTVIQLANWKDIFEAKLNFARYKDIWDYNRFIPNENNQTLSQQKQQAQQLYSQYLEQNPNGNVEQFKSWADGNQSNVKIPSSQNMQFDNNGLQPNIEENGVSSQPINEGVQIALEEVMQEQQENC